VAMDIEGKVGRLALVCNPVESTITNLTISPCILSGHFQFTGFNSIGRITNACGLALLNDLHSLSLKDIWIIWGNFNIIKLLEEKKR